jgi:hypothetical protein
MPCRRFLNVNVEVVVGVCGGDESPACWAKLKLGVVGRMVASGCAERANWKCALALLKCKCVWVKASTPAVDIPNEEKEDEGDCSS